jgi:hypothetical protein
MADPGVFTKSHDDVTSMLGSTLDFIGQESARSIEYQRYRQFQEQEAEKERGFKAEQEKLKSEREIQSNAFTSYLDNLDKLGPKGRAARQEALSGAIKNPDQLAAIMDRNPDILGMGIDVKEQLIKNPGLSQFLPAGVQTLTVPEWEEVMKNYHAHRNILAAKDDKEKWNAIQMYSGVIGDFMKRASAGVEGISMFGVPTGDTDAEGKPIFDSEGAGEFATAWYEDKQKKYAQISEYLAKGEIPPPEVVGDFWSTGDVNAQAKEYQRRMKLERANQEKWGAVDKRIAHGKQESALQRERAELEKYLETAKEENFSYRFSKENKDLRKNRERAKARLKEVKKQLDELGKKAPQIDSEIVGKEEEIKKLESKALPKKKNDGLDLFPDR